MPPLFSPATAFHPVVHAAGAAKLYGRAALLAMEHRAAFASVRTYAMFIGYPRSGHSLVGALLDAHPHVVLGHEADALKLVRRGVPRPWLYGLLLQASQRFAAAGAVGGGGYSYAVPGQWQGRYRRLDVIGDKRGGGSLKQLRARPELLARLRTLVAVPVRAIHVTRNPFDNIATMARRNDEPPEVAADRYFSYCETNLAVRPGLAAEELLDVRHEDFVAEPRQELGRLCVHLGVTGEADYLDAAAAIVRPSPHKSRAQAGFSPALVARIHARIDAFPFLRGYRFDD